MRFSLPATIVRKAYSDGKSSETTDKSDDQASIKASKIPEKTQNHEAKLGDEEKEIKAEKKFEGKQPAENDAENDFQGTASPSPPPPLSSLRHHLLLLLRIVFFIPGFLVIVEIQSKTYRPVPSWILMYARIFVSTILLIMIFGTLKNMYEEFTGKVCPYSARSIDND